jgi:tRNA(adenine34) deaminase
VQDVEFMRLALQEAAATTAMPIGAVLVVADRVVGRARWQGFDNGLLAHPEHVLLTGSDRSISWPERRAATLYTTLEPCLMCMGTAMSFFLGRIVYAAPAPADGAADVAALWQPRQGHRRDSGAYGLPVIRGGVMATESQELIRRWLDSGVTGPEAEFARRTLDLTN